MDATDWNSFEGDPVDKIQEEHRGFCIRCGKEIEFSSDLDDPYPYCLSCYRQWTSEGRDEEKKENFCHYYGKKAARITFRKPVEYECWKILK